MKKILASLLCLSFILGITLAPMGCGDKKTTTEQKKEEKKEEKKTN